MGMEVLTKRLKEIVGVAKKDLAAFDVFRYMNEMLQLVNLSKELKCEMQAWNGKVMVFEATDTGRAVSISFANGSVIGEMGERQDFHLKFEATENTYLELLSGRLDPDSAFFRRKIRIIGPIAEALRFKNILFARRFEGCERR